MIHPNLLLGIEEMRSASFTDLRDPAWVAERIRETGVCPHLRGRWDGRAPYDGREIGLLQSPLELARFLVLLSLYPLRTALEIGTFNGWTAALITAYLERWNPGFGLTTIDPTPTGPDHARIALSCLLPLTFARLTSASLRGRRFDLCFIDGLHAYRSVREDYLNAGQSAKICAFHDISLRDPDWIGSPDGGVARFWQELRQSLGAKAVFHEFHHPLPDRPPMGIGVRIFP